MASFVQSKLAILAFGGAGGGAEAGQRRGGGGATMSANPIFFKNPLLIRF